MKKRIVYTPILVIDGRETGHLGPLIGLSKKITSVPLGTIIELRSTDENLNDNFPYWVRKAGHEYLKIVPEDCYLRLLLRRLK